MICVPIIVEDGVTSNIWVNPKYIVSLREIGSGLQYVMTVYSSVNTTCEYRVPYKAAASLIETLEKGGK